MASNMPKDGPEEAGNASAIFAALTGRQHEMLNVLLKELNPTTCGLDWEHIAAQLDYKSSQVCRQALKNAFRKNGWLSGAATATDAALGSAPAGSASGPKARAPKKAKKAEPATADADADDGQDIKHTVAAVKAPKTQQQGKSTAGSGAKKRSAPAAAASVAKESSGKKRKASNAKKEKVDGGAALKKERPDRHVKHEEGVDGDGDGDGEDEDEV